MRRHTTIDLDMDLLATARRELGTTTTIDTIHAALAEVVRRRQREALGTFVPALTLTDLDAMRAHRFAEESAPYADDQTSE
jgi:Arc/MetJ family transcription regulator